MISASEIPMMCFANARSELPCATTKTRLPESIAGAIWSSQNGNARSKVNFKFSAFGTTSDGMFA